MNRTCPDEGAVKDCDQESGWSGREERLLKDMDGVGRWAHPGHQGFFRKTRT